MKVLHYALGFPPYRRGGLTKYCVDLMIAQYRVGIKVGMLWPGEMGIVYKKKPRIKKCKDVIINDCKLDSYELIGGLPVPLLEGVSNPNAYMENRDPTSFICFLNAYKPDVIHIHTLMGIPPNYINILYELNIKTVFTTHDYFGLCPKTTFIREGINCEIDNDCYKCIECNENAISVSKIRILQSGIYRRLKNSFFLKYLRKKYWKNNNQMNSSYYKNEKTSNEALVNKNNSFVQLRSNYISMLKKIDVLLFNSTNTERVYKKFINKHASIVMRISHSDIRDNRKIKYTGDVIQFAYLGPNTQHKGYNLLSEVCDKLWNDGYKFSLHIYFKDDCSSYKVSHKPYNYLELPNIMDKIDCVIVPSLWNETFGFVVPEALSCGVPVIVSDTVGAKDEIDDGKSGNIINAKFEELYTMMKKILCNSYLLNEMNKYICCNYTPMYMDKHADEIIHIYETINK